MINPLNAHNGFGPLMRVVAGPFAERAFDSGFFGLRRNDSFDHDLRFGGNWKFCDRELHHLDGRAAISSRQFVFRSSERRRHRSRHPGDRLATQHDGNRCRFSLFPILLRDDAPMFLWINPQKHGRIIAQKYWKQGKPAPVAVVLGCEPVTWMTASMSPPFGTSEYELAGAYRGAAVEVVELPVTKLPVPAEAEIVIEGVIPPETEETAVEGPFGKWPGYYTHQGPEAVVRIQRIYHRDRPILAGAPPLRPLNWSNFTNYVHLWEHLERSGVTDVTGVWGFYNGLLTVISLRQRYAGHAKQALITAAGFRHGDMKTYYVTVDDDIDPSNQEEVLWAMCTRVDPTTAVDVVRDAWTADLDPRVSPARRESGDLTVGRMLINACKPFSWRDQFPKTNVFSAEDRRQVETKWRDLLESVEANRRRSS